MRGVCVLRAFLLALVAVLFSLVPGAGAAGNDAHVSVSGSGAVRQISNDRVTSLIAKVSQHRLLDDHHAFHLPSREPSQSSPVSMLLRQEPTSSSRPTSQAAPIIHHQRPMRHSLLDHMLGPTGTCAASVSARSCILNLAASLLLMLWTFKNLKFLTDAYFVPSTFAIAERLQLDPDVAGATLLAFGSSAPELCANSVSTFLIVNEVGVGDIVGSSVHNVLLIVGVAGVFAGHDLKLWWYPMWRDCAFYLLAIFELVVVFWDERLVLAEALMMILTYVLYIACMAWNSNIHKKLCDILNFDAAVPSKTIDRPDDKVDGRICRWDPVELLWHVCMPCPRKSKYSCSILAISNIGIQSYFMVDAATRFGTLIGMPSLFMGLVFVAFGTSLPDAFGSVAAARSGEADMAVSNALGSNVFQILMGLGFPWMISLSLGKPVTFRVPTDHAGANHLLYWVRPLLISLMLLVVCVCISGMRLNRKTGVMLCLCYVAYVVWALLKSFQLVA